MKHHVYYPVRTADQIVWLENFRNKLGAYASALGLAAPRVTEAINDARWLVYVLGTFLPAVRAFSLACTQAGKQAQSGAGGPLALPVFTPPALPAGVTAADGGALSRTFDLVAEINESNGCTPAMCADLRIVGPEITGPDPATFRPELTLTVNVNSVFIGWGWGGFSAFLDQLEIQVDRGDGKGFQTLTYDTTPNYTDNHPFPPTLTRWHYRGIYRVDDFPFGQWSETVTVVVGG